MREKNFPNEICHPSKTRTKHTIEILQTLLSLCHLAKKAEGVGVSFKNSNVLVK